MDTISAEKRSALMSRIRRRDTQPEMAVRRLVHGMGYRYRLHGAQLPGRPDLVFGRRRKVIFVHGCFWHLHHCGRARLPKSRTGFWQAKLEGNRARDHRVRETLAGQGWSSLTIWECETASLPEIREKIANFLGSGR
jgi:DNA mismatch endonuclease (patch repair protein)